MIPGAGFGRLGVGGRVFEVGIGGLAGLAGLGAGRDLANCFAVGGRFEVALVARFRVAQSLGGEFSHRVR